MAVGFGSAVAFPPTGFICLIAKGVNFNAGNTDTVMPVYLPPGFTRYLVSTVRISGASGSLTTATVGLFTAAAAGGTAVIASPTAVTVASGTDGAANSAQAISGSSINTVQWKQATTPNLYFRVMTPQGSAATADVYVTIIPLP